MHTSKKRLVIEIDEDLRFNLKKRALNQRITLKDWILSAVAIAIQQEDGLEKKDE